VAIQTAVDDGRTPGRKAGWTDGLTDEERQLRDFYDPKADDEDERWVVENLKHTAISGTGSVATTPAGSARRRAGDGSGGNTQVEQSAHGEEAQTSAKSPIDEAHSGRRVGGVQLPPSDAVLSCPACFGMICLDCQRHESFGNQWRAMFAQNVRVLTIQLLSLVHCLYGTEALIPRSSG
jgi:hypothetical protein